MATPGGGGGEVVLIEFIGSAKSAVAAADETVAANERVAASAKKASEAGATAGASMSKKMSGAATGMSRVGKSLTKWVSLPLIGIGVAATKMSLDFSKSMLLIETHTDTSRKMVERYRKSILAMSASGNYTQGPKELADAMYHVASDGYKGAKALGVLRQSAHLATLGQSDLAETTYALVSAEKTGIRGTQSLHEAIGLLNGIVGAGDMKMQDLVGAMSTGILPAAKAVGLSLRDVGAALDVMTQRGQPAQQAAYRLRMNFAMLKPYTEKAQKEFEALGLGQEQLVNQLHKPQGLLRALEVLKEHMAGLNRYQQMTAIQSIFGGGRSSTGMLILLQNLHALEQSYGSINHLAGETNRNLKAALASPVNRWREEWAKLREALVEVGDQLVPVVIPALKDVAHVIVTLARGFSKLPHATQEWVIGLGALGIVLGPVLRLGGALTKTLIGISGAMTALGDSTVMAGLAQAFKGDTAILQIMATDLAGGLAKALPVGFAAVGIGNIISSLISGDMRDAGFEAGGALVGGIAGFMAGGPLGAALGVGIGSIGGEQLSGLFSGLFDSAKKTTPLQKALARSVQNLSDAMKRQSVASEGMARANHHLSVSQEQSRKATQGVHTAEQRLEAARKRYPANSRQVVKAETEVRLAKAKNIVATRNLQRAEHLHGIQLWAAKGAYKATVAAEKQRIELLNVQLNRIVRKLQADKKEHASNDQIQTDYKHLVGVERTLGQERGKLMRTLSDVAQKIGPAFAKKLKEASAFQLEFSDSTRRSAAALRALAPGITPLPALFKKFGDEGTSSGSHVRTSYERLKGVLGPFRSEAHQKLGQAGGDVKSWSSASTQGIGEVATSFNSFAGQLGVSQLKFGVTGGGGKRGPHKGQKKARGGFLEGAGLQDTVPVMAAPGEAFVTRHQQGPINTALAASKAMGVQPYGSLGEVFSGVGRPHYMASGGIVEPHLVGPAGGLRNVGQGAIHKVTEAARKYLRDHRPKGGRSGGGVGGLNVPLGPIQQMAHSMIRAVWGDGQWGPFTQVVQRESGWDPHAQNPRSTAYGIAQNLSPSTYPPAGRPGSRAPILEQARAQLQWMVRYIKGRYGSPAGAWAHEQSAGWYARGGYVKGRLRFARGGQVVLDPGVNMSVGKEPQILGDLKALSSQLGKAVYVISGYRSPSHSAAVGGFSNDPHTRGEAADIGIGSSLRSSASVLTEALLHSVNLDRPFYPASAAEINHVQLWKGGAGAGSAAKKAIAKVISGTTTRNRAGSTGRGGGTPVQTVVEHFKVKTKRLSFGSVPTDLGKARKELRQRVKQLSEYRAAYRQVKDPATKQAIATNVRLLENRIGALRKAIVRLIAKRRRDRKVAKIEGRGTFPGIEARIASIEDTYEKATERAQQIVELEPEEGAGFVGDFSAVLTSYIEQQEAPAWGNVLNPTLASWRNTLIGGENTATARVGSLEAQIRHIESLKGQGKGKNRNRAYNREKYKLPALRKAIATAKESYDAASGRGSFADRLKDVQGAIGPREVLGSLPTVPVAGKFGGLVWQAQIDIRDLGLKIRQAKEAGGGAGSQSNTELADLLKQQVLDAKKEQMLAEAQYGPFAAFLKAMPPMIGAFKTGGPIPGAPNQAYTAIVHGGEYVVPAGGTNPTHTHFHLHGDIASFLDIAAPDLVREVDQRLGTRYRHIAYGPGGRK